MIKRPVLTLRSPSAIRLAVLCFALWAAVGNAAEWGVDELMNDLAQTRSARARFVEKKSISLLDKPVESSGELVYRAPDHLEKRTFKPKPESMTVDQGTLIVERGRQKHSLQLNDYPELAAFIESIRGTLAGDRKALERNYRLSLEGTAENWLLQLVPLDEKMLAVVKQVRIGGSRDGVRSVETLQADGDSSLMRVEKLVGAP